MSDSNVDRNLLFGIIALQMDFVAREQFLSAMEGWVADKSKPIGRIMVEQGDFSDEYFELLDALVNKHLEKHDDDAAKSLAALSSVDPAIQDLTRIGDASVDESLIHLAQEQTQRPDETMPITDAADSPSAPAAPRLPGSCGARFRVLRPHAQGGLGRVSVARDEELNRDVAVKELHDQHADNPASRARFMLEAEVTGALDHPGIVPIYGLGQYGNSRPFYAMRFIRGDSLEEAIDRFYARENGRRDADERQLELRKLLRRFIDVCNAMQYAHSRGVLHRDLKPGNIMLGKYGETLVVDWGLAKPMNVDTDKFDSSEGSIQLSSDSLSSPTLRGSIVGTPQFMSPEQASGKLDQVGTAADVYSLGATLYYLLTGKPPITADDLSRLLRKVRQGDFPEPRRVNPNIPKRLNTICLKSMALKPEARHKTPRALADDLEHWLAEEPLSSQKKPLPKSSLFGRCADHAPLKRRWVAAAALILVTVVSNFALPLVKQSRFEQKQQRELAQTVLRREQEENRARRENAARGEQPVERNQTISRHPVDQRELVRLLMNRGILSAEKGNLVEARAAYDEAVRLLASLLEVESQVAATFQELASCYTHLGKLTSENESAVAAMEAALKQNEFKRNAQLDQTVSLNSPTDSLAKRVALKVDSKNSGPAAGD